MRRLVYSGNIPFFPQAVESVAQRLPVFALLCKTAEFQDGFLPDHEFVFLHVPEQLYAAFIHPV